MVNDIFILKLEHWVEYLSAKTADIKFGAETLPWLSLQNILREGIRAGLGELQRPFLWTLDRKKTISRPGPAGDIQASPDVKVTAEIGAFYGRLYVWRGVGSDLSDPSRSRRLRRIQRPGGRWQWIFLFCGGTYLWGQGEDGG